VDIKRVTSKIVVACDVDLNARTKNDDCIRTEI